MDDVDRGGGEPPTSGLPASASPAAGKVKRSFLPAFANERNRELDRQIRELEAQLEQTQVDTEENREHIKVLTEHLDNVRLEIKHTQGQLTAKSREVETEGHLKELSAREAGRLRTDAAKLARQRAELEARTNAMRTEVFEAQERLDQFRLVNNWNQEELEQWSAASKQKEEDALALERYRRQDEARVKELTMALERVTTQTAAAARELDDEVTATQAVQGELSKAADDFRRLHAERQELLGQWVGVLAAIARRDDEVLAAGEELAGRKARLVQLRGELATAARALEAEAATSAALTKQIAGRERGIKRQYEAFAAGQAAVAKAEEGLDLLSNIAAGAADEAAAAIAANGHARAEVARRAVALEMAQQVLAAASARLEDEAVQLDTAQQKLARLEALRQEERAKAEALDRAAALAAKAQFAAAQALAAAREEGRRLEGETGGARAQGRNLSASLARLEGHMVRQQEVLYNVDFQLVQMERKVARAAGQRTQDETAALNERIAALTAALEAAQKEHGMLVEQVKRAEDDHARAQRASQAALKERAGILDVMARLEASERDVEADATARAVKVATREKEERLVEVDVRKLEVRRLRGLLSSKSEEVLNLEHRKRTLELGMAERRSEVAVQMELMQGEARLLREDLGRVTRELKERQVALEKLRAKHETLELKGRGQEGEGAHSQAYYIVKSAQERQELSEEAEGLATAIALAEKECRALEATLQRLAGCNHDMNEHYRFGASAERAAAQAAAKAALERAAATARLRQGEEATARADLEEAQVRLENAIAEEEHMRRLVGELEAQRAEAERALGEQRQKQARAAQRVEQLRKRLRTRAAGSGSSIGAGSRPSTSPAPPRPGTAASRPGTAASVGAATGGRLVLPAGAASLADVEADVAMTLLRESTKGMVDALRAAAAELPEVAVLQRVEASAGIKLAAEGSAANCGAGSHTSSPCCSRPASALPSTALAGSVRGSPRRPGSSSAVSVASGPGGAATSRSSASTKSAAVATLQLQL